MDIIFLFACAEDLLVMSLICHLWHIDAQHAVECLEALAAGPHSDCWHYVQHVSLDLPATTDFIPILATLPSLYVIHLKCGLQR